MLFLPSEQDRLDRLIAKAIQDIKVQERLLRFDRSLQAEYGIQDQTWQCLSQIQAQSLEDFCKQACHLKT